MCTHLPIELFLQILVFITFIIIVIAVITMYRNGYWSLEERKARWNRTHFTTWK